MYVSKRFLKDLVVGFAKGAAYGTWIISGGIICYVGTKMIVSSLDQLTKELSKGDSTNEPK